MDGEDGIAAVTVAGVVVGNSPSHVHEELTEFKEQLTVMLIGMLFILLAADVQGFVRVSRDGVLGYAPWPEKRPILSQVDVLKTDAVEAEMLTGETDIQAAARALADLGPGDVVITHRDGVLVYAEGKVHQAGFSPRELVGRSGRGDTCLAAYVAQRLVSSAGEATVWAAAVTSLKMEAEGPFRREIREVLDLIQQSYAHS